LGKERSKILNVNINLISYQDLIKTLTTAPIDSKHKYICFANVHMIIEAYRNETVRNAINNASYTVTDGMPLVKTLGILYRIKQDRIPGMDFMPGLMKEAENKKFSVFFFGSTHEILTRIISKAKHEFPALHIAGSISPPFRALLPQEENAYIEKINQSGATYLFVGLGCPKQELWMSRNRSKIKAIQLGVGGAFEVYVGMKKRAPIWIQRMSLEWIYRLLQDPKRLFKRYITTNSIYLYLITIEFIKIRILRMNA